MERALFWTLIEEARRDGGGDCRRMAYLLTRRLSDLSIEEILGFQHTLNIYVAVVHKLEAVYVLVTGLPMSDDQAECFCMWLIQQGEGVCEAAWGDPDVLADAPLEDGCPSREDLLGVARTAYTIRTGESIPFLDNDPSQYLLPANSAIFPDLPRSAFLPDHESHHWKEWSEERLRTSCPKLWAKYGR